MTPDPVATIMFYPTAALLNIRLTAKSFLRYTLPLILLLQQ
jgi:hypothetical protein